MGTAMQRYTMYINFNIQYCDFGHQAKYISYKNLYHNDYVCGLYGVMNTKYYEKSHYI